MLAHREESILRQHDKDPQHNDKNLYALFGVFVCIFDSMLKIFIMPSNRAIYLRQREKDPQLNDKNLHGFLWCVCVFCWY